MWYYSLVLVLQRWMKANEDSFFLLRGDHRMGDRDWWLIDVVRGLPPWRVQDERSSPRILLPLRVTLVDHSISWLFFVVLLLLFFFFFPFLVCAFTSSPSFTCTPRSLVTCMSFTLKLYRVLSLALFFLLLFFFLPPHSPCP